MKYESYLVPLLLTFDQSKFFLEVLLKSYLFVNGFEPLIIP